MDSLKIPKGASSSSSSGGGGGGGAKPSGSVPITVRFNAGDECIDDIFQSFHNNSNSGGGGGGGGGGGSSANSGGGDSLSSSPSQHHQTQSQASADEVNTRNNFLQGGFFNRKRSGSIENISPTSAPGPNLIAALSSSDATSVGTWKLIKGKVSQTIEDIKSSKSSSQPQTVPTVIAKTSGEQQSLSQPQPQHDPDSDQENITANTSISEDLPWDILSKPTSTQQLNYNRGGDDSDSEFENEIFLEADIERSRLRRGFAKLKSKVKEKHAARQQHQHHSTNTLSTLPIVKSMKDTSPTGSRSSMLRRRHGKETGPVETTGERITSSVGMVPEVIVPPVSQRKSATKKGIIAGKKDVEIESGVEMLEDMIPPTPTTATGDADTTSALHKMQRDDNKEKKLPLEIKNAQDAWDGPTSHLKTNRYSLKSLMESDSTLMGSAQSYGSYEFIVGTSRFQRFKRLMLSMPTLTFLGFVLILSVPMHDFIRGILACLLSIAVFEFCWTFIQKLVVRLLVTHPPEKNKFLIPEFNKMNILEIPAVEEHTTVKAYAGWMNEVNSYDPNNFHISMSKSVYVKLDGTIMRMSTTTARIPKKAMWNEAPIDRKTLVFTEHRTYNLLGCRIELLPLGLAKKRYFNRKYPIQLIIKDCPEPTIVVEEPINVTKRPSTISNVSKEDIEAINLETRDSKPSLAASSQMPFLTPQQSGAVEADEREVSEKKPESEMEFASTILNADLQTLQNTVNPDADLKEITLPCGDEVRLLLFSRGDREKEDWYRRFVAASTGEVHDKDLRLPNMKLVTDTDLQAAAAKAAQLLTESNSFSSPRPSSFSAEAATFSNANEEPTPDKEILEDDFVEANVLPDETYEGLLMSTDAARNPVDYIRFMAIYQSACNQTNIPVYKVKSDKQSEDEAKQTKENKNKQRRNKQQEDELWRGIDQSLFLGPSGSVVWANVLVGRFLYSVLKNAELQVKIQDFLQKKLSSIKLPAFMEDVIITHINMGDTPPLIHRISQPMLDERGTWVDADVTYEGLLQITVTTKLNLLRMKRPTRVNVGIESAGIESSTNAPPIPVIPTIEAMASRSSTSIATGEMHDATSGSAIFDSDAESSGGSSSESEERPVTGPSGETNVLTPEFNVFQTAPGNARRIFRIVDRIATSNFFQYATELSYVQRAMENMSANITLRVDLKGLVSRATLNIPPPPSDRIWLSFRGPPRLWISAKPAVGDKSFDWSIVTNIIESKICEEVNKFLVYPNMVDVTIPFLGQPTYTE